MGALTTGKKADSVDVGTSVELGGVRAGACSKALELQIVGLMAPLTGSVEDCNDRLAKVDDGRLSTAVVERFEVTGVLVDTDSVSLGCTPILSALMISAA